MSSLNDFAREVLLPALRRQRFRENFRDAVRREQWRVSPPRRWSDLEKVGAVINIRKPRRFVCRPPLDAEVPQ